MHETHQAVGLKDLQASIPDSSPYLFWRCSKTHGVCIVPSDTSESWWLGSMEPGLGLCLFSLSLVFS